MNLLYIIRCIIKVKMVLKNKKSTRYMGYYHEDSSPK